MLPRLERYKEFIEKEYIKSLTNNQAHDLSLLKPDLKRKIRQGQFERIVFSGMGCSAIVVEMIKGFLIEQKIPLRVEIINDYMFEYFIEPKIIKDKKTLIIISSEGGCSQEPLKFYERVKKLTKNIIFLTAGGELGKIAAKDKVSLISWQLKNPDKNYAVLHAPEYFVNLLNIFFKLRLIKNNHERDLKMVAKLVKKEFSRKKIATAEQLAKKIKNRDIILVANSLWHLTLLKLVAMHLNELALTPAHSNGLHEFTHCEVLTLTKPQTKLALIIFQDQDEDEYTKNKIQNLVEVLTKKIKPDKNREVVVINLERKNFLQNFFSTLLKMQYVAYFLGVNYNSATNDLVAKTALKYENFNA